MSRPPRYPRVFTSKRTDIKSDKIKDMRGEFLHGINDARYTVGMLLFVDMESGEWPHNCAYILIEPGPGGHVVKAVFDRRWPPIRSIAFHDPSGLLEAARQEVDNLRPELCKPKHLGPLRSGGRRTLNPIGHNCYAEDGYDCDGCKPTTYEVMICESCKMEVSS